MTPFNLILWALAIGGAWLILSFCLLIDRWMDRRMESLTLGKKKDAPADPEYRNGSSIQSNRVEEVSPDDEGGAERTGDRE